MQTRPLISHIIIMGDSLSDRGELYNRKLGCIPMRLFTDLPGKSPDGRFTNGLAWDDNFSAAILNQFAINKFEKKRHLDATDIADDIIDHDPAVEPTIEHEYSLNNDTYISYDGRQFVRSYCEGGLTAHNYKWAPSDSISRYFSRIILSTLEQKRKELLAYDKDNQISDKQTKHTLVIEWSGANDLITVNKRPSKLEADKAVAARIKNVEKLIENGYRHFILFNLPDLSLTPRYQAKSQNERDNAHKWCLYLNKQLYKACTRLSKTHGDCSIQVFDINERFTRIYQNPGVYQLDKDKLTTPYATSNDFKMLPNGTSPSNGYMFWDDVHPTAEVHALLASKFCNQFESKFDFIVPKKLQKRERKRLTNSAS